MPIDKTGWPIGKFGDVVKNDNLVERNPESTGNDRIVGLEHIDPENLHIRSWNSFENGTSFTRKFVPGQTLFGKRRAYQRKVVYAEFEGFCSGDILTFEPIDKTVLLPDYFLLSARRMPFSIMPWVLQQVRFLREQVGKRLKISNFPFHP